MPMKRRTSKTHDARITPEAVALFQLGEEQRAAGKRERERAAFLETCLALDRALGLKPWNAGPLAIVGDAPPPWMDNENELADWRNAAELRRRLVEAAKAHDVTRP